MSPRHLADEPELVPPVELLRLRARLVRAPSVTTRARHLAAVAAVAQATSTPAGRFASRGVRGAAAVVATLAITSGLAAAQVLPTPAQRIFSSVSDRFTSDEAPPATAGAPDDVADDASSRSPEPDDTGAVAAVDPTDTAPVDEEPVVAAAETTTTTTPTTTTEPAIPPTTTIPGPTEPGSPDDPTDPGSTDGGPTEPGTDGGPTEPGSDDGTAGTTEVPPTTEAPTEDPVPTAGGSG